MPVNVREVADPAESSAVVGTGAQLRVVDAPTGAFPDCGHSLQGWMGRPLADRLGAGSWAALQPQFRSAVAAEHPRDTVERRSGSLACSSSPGAGATFTIRLALHRQPTAVAEAVQP